MKDSPILTNRKNYQSDEPLASAASGVEIRRMQV